MSPDDPRHGTYAGGAVHYKEHTPLCDPCRDAWRTYARRYKKSTRMGRTYRVPVRLVQRRISRLRDNGMSLVNIADAAGVSLATVTNIADARHPAVSMRVAAAIADVTATPGDGTIAAWRIERRLKALYALGWTSAEVARRTGWSSRNVRCLMDGHRRQVVKAATFVLFDRVYRELSMCIPPDSPGAKVARDRATKKRWPPPLAYDDIDDPNDRPRRQVDRNSPAGHQYDEAVVLRILGGEYRLHATIAERHAVIARWDGTLAELARRTGWKIERYHKVGAA